MFDLLRNPRHRAFDFAKTDLILQDRLSYLLFLDHLSLSVFFGTLQYICACMTARGYGARPLAYFKCLAAGFSP